METKKNYQEQPQPQTWRNCLGEDAETAARGIIHNVCFIYGYSIEWVINHGYGCIEHLGADRTREIYAEVKTARQNARRYL